MLRLYVPVAVTVVIIAALTAWEGVYSDRFRGSSVTAEEFGKRFQNLPMTIGNWEGEDHPVDEKTLDVAGAVNHVSRVYRNPETGEQVDVWLVVGHSRDICRHTPDVCYLAQGFSRDGNIQKHRVEVEGEEPATFYTARFRREDLAGVPTRVFWSWNGNEPELENWEAPDNQRYHYGNNTALYKMYFTARMGDRDELASDNVAARFAEVMLPVVNRALFPERYQGTAMPTAEAAAAVLGDSATTPTIGESPADSLPSPTGATTPTEGLESEIGSEADEAPKAVETPAP
jgi:Protein of unknown function (DUF3485)